MKRLSGLIFCFVLTGCAATTSQPNSGPSIDRDALLDHYVNYQKSIVDAGAAESAGMVRDEAVHIGTQAGYYWAATEINKALESASHLLDQIDFKPLLFQESRYYIVPPVISKDEGRRVINETGRFIRLIDATFYIERNPRFTLEPPTWREYLFLDLRTPDKPTEAMLPTSKRERAMWMEGVQTGFEFGIRQAELTFQNKNAHLTQVYQGMILYHVLLAKNMVTAPRVKESYAPVVGGGRRLIIEDSTVSIEVMPSLNANRYAWEVIPQLPDVSHLFPNVINLNIRKDD